MENKIRPTGVTADRTKRIVTIEWNDGSSCDYPFAGLRAICPCVTCRGGHEHMGVPADKLVLQRTKNDDLTLEQVATIGSYAIQFKWGDGHDTGIYTWEYLYEACH
ncbi:MAG: DUF971 domain-containing protein [Chloroflexota bacterium]